MTLEQIELFEEWRQVIGYEGFYEISNWGRVRSLGTYHSRRIGRLLNPEKVWTGYLRVRLSKANKQRHFSIHSLVASAFIGPCPNGKCVDHINGDKANNSLPNLRYLTQKENIEASIKRIGCWHGKYQRVIPVQPSNPKLKLTDDQVMEIRRLSLEGMTQWAIANEFGVNQATVWRIIHRKSRIYKIGETYGSDDQKGG